MLVADGLTDIQIIDSRFHNITSQVGAISFNRLSNTTYTLISGCEFENCTAQTNAGLSITSSNITIENSVFKGNKATGDRNGAGDGAAIYLSDTYEKVIQNCTFLGNEAVRNGGAIFWNGIEPIMMNNTFIDNEAPYGPDIATTASWISIENASRRL